MFYQVGEKAFSSKAQIARYIEQLFFCDNSHSENRQELDEESSQFIRNLLSMSERDRLRMLSNADVFYIHKYPNSSAVIIANLGPEQVQFNPLDALASNRTIVLKAFREIVRDDLRAWKHEFMREHNITRVWCNQRRVQIANKARITVDHIYPFSLSAHTFLEANKLEWNDLDPIYTLQMGYQQITFDAPHQRVQQDWRDYHNKSYMLDSLSNPHPKLQLMSMADNETKGTTIP